MSATDKSSYTGFATGLVAPTETTCQQFASHTGGTLAGENYLVSKGKIGSVSPGVFFYYSKIVVTASTSSFVVRQSNNGSWPMLGVQQAILWNADCTKSTVTPTTAAGNTTFNTSGLQPGTYYVSIKYDPGSIVGRTVSAPYPTVTYTLGTFVNGSAYLSSTRQVAFKPKA